MGVPLVGRDRQLVEVERFLAGGGQAAVIYGSEGVGKTRLARELLARAGRRGNETMSLLATPAAASIPFAALAGLVPATGAPVLDTAAVVSVCRRHIEQVTAVSPLGVLIDDAHWLDVGSLSLLQHLVALRRVWLVLTVRADVPAPGEITGLWKDDLALRVDLEPLDRAGTEQLIELTVGSRPHPTSEDRLWELSQGNPLFLRELLLAAREQGRLLDRPGGWELEAQSSVTPRLADLVSGRLDGLDDRSRLGLEVLTLLEPMGTEPFVRLLGADTVARLEAVGTIEVTQVGRRQQVRFGHPVYGEVVRATTPHGRWVQVAELLLDTLPEEPKALADPAMLARLWSLAGRPGRAELFTGAARQALGASDHAAAEELAGSAVERGGGFEARLTYGEALVYRGRTELAEQVLEEAAAQALGDEQVARVALLQVHDALFNRGDLARADELVVEASGKVEERGWRDQLDATRALTAGLRGDLRGALAVSEPLRQREDVEPRVLLGVLTVSTVAHTLLGDLVAARQDVRRAEPLLGPLQAALPLAGDQIRIIEVGGELYDGRVSDAVALANKGYEVALEAGMAGQVGAWAVTLAMTLVSAGRLADALRLTDAAIAKLEVADPLALRGTALSFRVLCAAALRDEPEPSEAILEQLQTSGERDLRVRIHAGRAHVWLTAAQGDLEGACHLAVKHGRWAVGASHDVWGAMTLHDAVRFGHPELVEADLAALSRAHDAELLQLFADHAMALDSQDPDALRDVAARFSAGGAELYAAEAMAQAADELHRQGQPRAADTAATVASELLSRGSQAITPALLHAEDPLTNREREIAIMARRGMSSREIAETLVLSPRTIDNHLAAVYSKAGIDGRHQLHDLGLGEQPQAT